MLTCSSIENRRINYCSLLIIKECSTPNANIYNHGKHAKNWLQKPPYTKVLPSKNTTIVLSQTDASFQKNAVVLAMVWRDARNLVDLHIVRHLKERLAQYYAFFTFLFSLAIGLKRAKGDIDPRTKQKYKEFPITYNQHFLPLQINQRSQNHLEFSVYERIYFKSIIEGFGLKMMRISNFIVNATALGDKEVLDGLVEEI